MGNNKVINQLNDSFEILNFKSISSLDDEDFKILVLDFFSKVKKLKDEGLCLNEDLKEFIDSKHIEYYDFYEKSIIYEERMQLILSELIGFCSPPKFWETSFNDYMLKKWGIIVSK